MATNLKKRTELKQGILNAGTGSINDLVVTKTGVIYMKKPTVKKRSASSTS